jgi:hypothetical protein
LTLSNNYHDFQKRPQYMNWVRAVRVPVNNNDDFYLYKHCCEGLLQEPCQVTYFEHQIKYDIFPFCNVMIRDESGYSGWGVGR